MENKTKHTPAPWHIMSAKQMSVPYIVYVGNETIFQCYNTSDKDDAKANALLIAAAPDMLSMLQELMAHKTFASHLPTTALKVKALIKKATGDE